MAAYAAVLSLTHIIDQLERHRSPPISIDKQQVEYLNKKLTFLQEFLETYQSPVSDGDEADPLEMRIADAAYAAEDVIESYIVDNIHLAAATDRDDEISCIHFYEDLEQGIEEMDLINLEVMEMVREKKTAVGAQLRRKVSAADSGFRSSERKSTVMVGHDDVLLQLLDKLTGGNPNRQIIPIVGMGGIGKTTLAQSVFGNLLIKEHFDICVWATISQDYNILETLSQVLSQAGGYSGGRSENELGEALHKHLFGRRYLVVMDDMWSIEVWDKMNLFFPDCNNRSRILVTTRLSYLAAHLTDSDHSIDMRFLDEDSSWTLFSKTIFGEESFPLELERIGKEIVRKCKGLPLSIAVVGGLLAKSEHTQEYWEHIEENLNSILSWENDQHCLRILKMSYSHLPGYLKPCFLYMGLFDEDAVIWATGVIRAWVVDGFLKPIDDKDLETIATEYLNELVARNLIQVHRLGLLGKIKSFKIHDLLRDIALQEGKKQRFYYVWRQYDPLGINGHRHICIPRDTSKEEVLHSLKSMAHARSYVCHNDEVSQFPESKLLRTVICSDHHGHSMEQVFELVNSRYLSFGPVHKVPSSIKLLWNLHTLVVSCRNDLIAPIEIWNMHNLRHVVIVLRRYYGELYLPEPPSSSDNDIVIMENLHTLTGVVNFNLNEEVIKRIPNIKKLSIRYSEKVGERVNCLSYLQCLSKLKTFRCITENGCDEYLINKISFPHSLKNLSLETSSGSSFEWDDVLQKIGSLPLLRKLSLECGSFKTGKWEIIEGQFPSLRSLELRWCDLEIWVMSEIFSCFPPLEVIHLGFLNKLKEIPLEIGEIATLRSMKVDWCSESAVLSAKKIVEEQEDLHGDQLDFVVEARVWNKALKSLATPNFRVL